MTSFAAVSVMNNFFLTLCISVMAVSNIWPRTMCFQLVGKFFVKSRLAYTEILLATSTIKMVIKMYPHLSVKLILVISNPTIRNTIELANRAVTSQKHAVLLLESGASLKYVSNRLGHKTIKTTADTYLDITEKIEEDELQKFASYIKR
jgi:integrase